MAVDTPLLIILPGFDGSVELYKPFCQFIKEEQEAIVIGYPTDVPLTINELVVYAEDRIPKDRPVILMGVSFSGPIAVRLLARDKREYIGAVFCTTFITPPRPFLLKLRSIFPISSLRLFFSMPSLIRYFFYQRDSNNELIERFQKANRKLHPSVITCRVKTLAYVDEQEMLGELPLPCCYLQASQDRIVPQHSVEALRTILGNLQVRTIDGPHALLQCKPQDSWIQIRNFIEKLMP